MRLAGQTKMGFFPIPPECADLIGVHLALGDYPQRAFRPSYQILDPCCGGGAALQRIGRGLGILETHLYGIELDRGRNGDARALMPRAPILPPTSFLGLGTLCTPHSFGMVYANPPFDDELGGGAREEERFLSRARHLLAPSGILVAVMPFETLRRGRGTMGVIDQYFEDVRVWTFPEAHRKFDEIVVIGRKRAVELTADQMWHQGDLRLGGWDSYRDSWRPKDLDQVFNLPDLGQPAFLFKEGWKTGVEETVRVYKVPTGMKPNVWAKGQMTDEEKAAAILSSPLNKILDVWIEPDPARPPLPLGRGHLGMFLAAGQLDGVVPAPKDPETGEPLWGGGPHVIRGTAKKVTIRSADPEKTFEREEVNAEGDISLKVQVTWTESIVTTIRTLDSKGEIVDFTESKEVKEVVSQDDDEPVMVRDKVAV